MVRVITQETFDLVVAENMEEFEMDRAEAVRDAKEQFEQQGVSLVNIVVSEQGSQVRINLSIGPVGMRYGRKNVWFEGCSAHQILFLWSDPCFGLVS